MKTVLNLIAVLGLLSPSPSTEPVWVERHAYLMGTVLRARVAAADRVVGLEALEEVFVEVRRLEGVLSSWAAASEIGHVNGAAAGAEVPVSSELVALLSEAAWWSGRTAGAFDPAIGALIDAWDLRGEGRRPLEAELAEALGASGAGGFDLDAEGSAVRKRTGGAWLDTGGFGKGAALRSAERVLRGRGIEAAYLDFGGQVLVYGKAPEAGGWEVAVAHPTRRHEPAAALRLDAGSVATSGQSERFVEVGGERVGHVLDPRTGLPVAAWGSVTVVAADPLVADLLSTALLVMGPVEGMRWAEAHSDVGVLYLEVRGGEVLQSWNSTFEQYLIDN